MTKGGKREGAGRKPSKDKKVQIQIFVEGSKVNLVGGKEIAKEIAYNAIDQKSKEE